MIPGKIGEGTNSSQDEIITPVKSNWEVFTSYQSFPNLRPYEYFICTPVNPTVPEQGRGQAGLAKCWTKHAYGRGGELGFADWDGLISQ